VPRLNSGWLPVNAAPGRSAAVGTLTEKFHTDQNSPFGCAKLLDDTVADSQPEPQMRSIARPF